MSKNKLEQLFSIVANRVDKADVRQLLRDNPLNMGGSSSKSTADMYYNLLTSYAKEFRIQCKSVHREVRLKPLPPVEVSVPVELVESFKSKFLKVSDLVELFGVTKQTVSNWIRDGKIKPFGVGGGIRFTQKEVDRFTKSR